MWNVSIPREFTNGDEHLKPWADKQLENKTLPDEPPVVKSPVDDPKDPHHGREWMRPIDPMDL
jgi:hypothetical protein